MAGDSAASTQLYSVYIETMYRYVFYRVGGKATAEDLCSEVFVRAFAHLHTFAWQGRNFGA
ncbi:DNA-directed RNA polymerase specialized sigma24 family protein [Streptomyces sp. 3330]|uniref:sigma factor n=1 Tax=Streptomyces sp. 3330 TaxID=2817755 RepID=UPI002862D5E9|nr:sigma factor [Streptomyces sp. 3330]MDR6980849.1 DNA-directed RNA polymerase specialized sigma24 family protein [Streptomyces sp. 3330]